MLGILGFLLMGLIAGAIARFVYPGRQPMGLVKTMGLGCLGSLVGGTIASLLGGELALTTSGFIGSVLGAVLVLFIGLRMSRRARI